MKTVTLRWNTCLECPYIRFDSESDEHYCLQNQHLTINQEDGTIPDDCPVEDE